MAKKVKRKVSSVSQSGARNAPTAEAVMESPRETAASSATPGASTSRSYSRRAVTAQEFNPDYTYVVKDLKRIGALAGTFFIILIALSFILPQIIK